MGLNDLVEAKARQIKGVISSRLAQRIYFTANVASALVVMTPRQGQHDAPA